jgi:hypothetical protein
MALLPFLTAPPAPFVPEYLRGAPMVAVGFCHTGSLEEEQWAAARGPQERPRPDQPVPPEPEYQADGVTA